MEVFLADSHAAKSDPSGVSSGDAEHNLYRDTGVVTTYLYVPLLVTRVFYSKLDLGDSLDLPCSPSFRSRGIFLGWGTVRLDITPKLGWKGSRAGTVFSLAPRFSGAFSPGADTSPPSTFGAPREVQDDILFPTPFRPADPGVRPSPAIGSARSDTISLPGHFIGFLVSVVTFPPGTICCVGGVVFVRSHRFDVKGGHLSLENSFFIRTFRLYFICRRTLTNGDMGGTLLLRVSVHF